LNLALRPTEGAVEQARLVKDAAEIATLRDAAARLTPVVQTVLARVGARPVGVMNAVTVRAGSAHTCVVDTVGAVLCFGSNEFGQLGSGGMTSATPVQVLGLGPATALCSGSDHNCALVGDNAWCWGANGSGQLGDGSTTGRRAPAPVVDSEGRRVQFQAVACGANHTCAVRTIGAALCWGDNAYGQAGYSSAPPQLLGPDTAVAGGARVDLASGLGSHLCGKTEDRGLKCWGLGANGQLGLGDMMHRTEATLVDAVTDLAGVSLGARHTCSLERTGVVSCWGANDLGQLGTGAVGADVLLAPGVSIVFETM
jgi:alpha-tubulin suppressor-like RCC1 family protein